MAVKPMALILQIHNIFLYATENNSIIMNIILGVGDILIAFLLLRPLLLMSDLC